MPSSNVCWGIDLGAGAIKAIKLERDGDSVTVSDFVVAPHKKVLSTPDLDEADAVRVALGALMGEYRDSMRNATVAVSVPGHLAFARFAKLPPVEPKGVANLVRFEAVQQIPFPIEEVEWDYQVFASDDSPDVEAGIFAITRERVHEKLSLWGEAGLSPDAITLGPVAVYNAIAYDLAFTEKSPGTVILDIGSISSDLIIAEGGRVWIRTFPLGGHHFTEALAETFKLNYTKAEKLKREAETSKYKRHIFQALKPILSDLVQEVQRSIGYFQDTHPDAKLERLIGLGSTFKLLGLRKLLSQQLKMEVFRLEGFKRLGVDGPGGADFEAASLNMATAYGLAVQGLGLSPIRANLMPVSVIRESLWRRKTPWFVAAASVAIVGGGASFLRPFLDSADLRKSADDPLVSSVISQGNRLKGEWDRIARDNQPTFRAENIRALFERRDLYHLLLKDVEEINAFAAGVALERDAAPEGETPLSVHALSAEYLAPGSPLAAPGRPGAGAGRDRDPFGGRDDRDDRRGGGGFDPNAGLGGGEDGAGQFGAVRLTLTVDSPVEDGATFFNDTVLEWLRRGVDPTRRPYDIVEAPRIEDVTQVRIEPDGAPAPRPGGPGGPGMRPPGAGGGSPFGSGGTVRGRALGGGSGGGAFGGDPDGRRPPAGPGPGASADDDASMADAMRRLNALAPLAPPEGERDGPVTRYTVTWTVQLREGLAEPEDAPPDGDEQASAGDATARGGEAS